MPESKGPAKKVDADTRGAAEAAATSATAKTATGKVAAKKSTGSAGKKKNAPKMSREERRRLKDLEPSPRWWAPLMVTLMVVGLIYIVVYYLKGSEYPIPGITHWNLAIGFAIILVGFAMTTRWK